MVFKKSLQFLKGRKMGAAEYVDQASSWAEKLVLRETRGPGDLSNAMRRLATRLGVPYAAFWALRYKPPKSIDAHIYFAFKEAAAEQEEAAANEYADIASRLARLESALLTVDPDFYSPEIDARRQSSCSQERAATAAGEDSSPLD